MESILEQRLRTGATIHSSLLHAVKSHAWGGVWRVVQCSFYSPFALPYPFSSFLCPDLNPFRFHHPSSLTICLPVGFGQRKVPGRDLRAGGERDRSFPYNIVWLMSGRISHSPAPGLRHFKPSFSSPIHKLSILSSLEHVNVKVLLLVLHIPVTAALGQTEWGTRGVFLKAIAICMARNNFSWTWLKIT